MMSADGLVKILDFGLAKLVGGLPIGPVPSSGELSSANLEAASASGPPQPSDLAELHAAVSPSVTRSGAMLGTPLYMSPESWQSAQATPRSDVYSLGVLIFEMCCGHPPHLAETAIALGWRVISKDAPSLAKAAPDAAPGLIAVVDRCLRRNPAERFASGEELCQALESLAAKPPPIPRRLVLTGLTLLLLALATFAGLGLHQRRQAQLQADLAQKLGQQIKDMEWMLRSARQLPLHDLGREKSIVRQRMTQLQTELGSYGELGRGLAHYAIGRGHMALHEYPEALVHLQQAIQHGNQSTEVRYSLGFVLGKHFEQAIYEARLSGGGDWATKQLKEIEPKYLIPAISYLQSSRAMKVDAPYYPEGLIAFYQRKYGVALQLAEAAFHEAPWLYEAPKLSGDIHLEQALQASGSGHYEEAEREFADAVQDYQTAAAVGQSDGEVYEGLAEAWVRRIEMAVNRGQPTEAAYAAAVTASDKIIAAEPQSIAGPLKKARVSVMTMTLLGSGLSSMERVSECLAQSEAALQKHPGHPYASEVAATCYLSAADEARVRGKNPEPLLHSALSLLEPMLKRYPYFLWALNDLGNANSMLGDHLHLHGNPTAKEVIQKSLKHYAAAASLDPTYIAAPGNFLNSLRLLVLEAYAEPEVQSALSLADDWFAKCKSINAQDQQCFSNYFQIYARASSRTLLAGRDPQHQLQSALEGLAETRKLGGSFLDTEQHAALAHLVEAGDRVKRKLAPSPALAALQADLTRCFTLAPNDAMCRTLAAQAEWVRSDWRAAQHQSIVANLQAALVKAQLATQSPELYPDAWQTLAEAHLRLANVAPMQSTAFSKHLAQGLDTVARAFSINPNHARSLATLGALQLARAQAERDPRARTSSAQAAAQSLAQALQHEPFLAHTYAPLLKVANTLVQTPL